MYERLPFVTVEEQKVMPRVQQTEEVWKGTGPTPTRAPRPTRPEHRYPFRRDSAFLLLFLQL